MEHIERFFIKPGYVAREAGAYFEDSLVTSDGIVHQPDVYAFAGYLARKFECTHILDIGCGSGHKLAKLHPEFSVVGVDFGVNIDSCRSRYPFGQWLSHDLETPHGNLLPPEMLKRTLVVCSDVIEHLVDPTGLLQTLQHCLAHAPAVILTTPERDLVRGQDNMGPPANPAHVREWNQSELMQLLEKFSFEVAFLGLTCNNDRDLEKKTVLAVLHGNRVPRKQAPVNDDFRVVAFMTAYNEEDIIFNSVSRLLDAGIEVYLINNWSTDGTEAAVRPLLGKGLIGIENFPAEGSTGRYDWGRLLTRVEELARTIPADWFIHHDADEIRESPWPELRLKEALQYVDSMGFNSVDHTVIDFAPVDNSFVAGSDFGAHFKHWEFGRRPGHFQQVKAWKNLGSPITLASTGGHDVNFADRRIFPYKFLLRHYPVRSQDHGNKKVLVERRPRFDPKERTQRGWHIQYDHIKDDHHFVRTPESLNYFNAGDFSREYLLERISGIGIVRQLPVKLATAGKTGLFQRLRSLLGIS